MNAPGVTAGPAESNGRLLLSIWRDSLHVTCGLTACTPGSAPGPTLGNEYGKTLLYLYPHCETEGASHNNHQSVSGRLSADWNKTVFSWRQEAAVDRSEHQLCRQRVPCSPCGPCRRFVDGSAARRTRSPDDEARSADRAGTSATDVSKPEMYTGVCPSSDLWTSNHSRKQCYFTYFKSSSVADTYCRRFSSRF